MKLYKSVLIICLCASTTLLSQIPNSGFENWNGSVPVDWKPNNIP